jgi:hypothetical protein
MATRASANDDGDSHSMIEECFLEDMNKFRNHFKSTDYENESNRYQGEIDENMRRYM